LAEFRSMNPHDGAARQDIMLKVIARGLGGYFAVGVDRPLLRATNSPWHGVLTAAELGHATEL
jgi:hypothetical protein